MAGLGYKAYKKTQGLSTTEVAYVDGVTAGSATAGKALVPDTSNNISGLNELGAAKFVLASKITAIATVDGSSTATMATAINSIITGLQAKGLMATA
jgi:hypothetical protein